MNNSISTIPKKIWMLWLQGIDNAPHIVQCCYQSWKKNNPDWELIVLDENNLSEYVDLNLSEKKKSKLSFAGYSDLVRAKLLSDNGGVWVDATSFCVKPLDSWLPEYTQSGFFAFRNPGADRLLSSWFLASEKHNYVIDTLYRAVDSYWRDNPLSNKSKGPLIAPFDYFLNRSVKYTKYWFHPFITKILGIFPYFYFHYMFAKLLAEDQRFSDIWQKTPVMGADIPHKVLHSKMLLPITDEIKAHIDNKIAPLYKLSWKFDQSKFREGSTLDYLLKTIDSAE
ncbi:capsular polysaccharide synthesis protein [Colwellia hornerae]|uniref:Capsular biosynthesis protein n=1 Tax=Colwellia hornerae TaxID=89402 RepID=A0A5C6QAR0_9GAMM|nr:capsular polysaccharide synthesis protein [Colwellia hornerae]TWX51084.1 hypothetical protein ESZ28_14935 [Colwellia hornerae]TWX56762.1 hypothetical protein ESZ26_14900 [Colwellia hornerae]TWX65732.1 hypothetical protein ESZ27_12165 [Colwellia hornerae]